MTGVTVAATGVLVINTVALLLLLLLCQVSVHDRACNAVVSDNIVGLHRGNARTVCRL